MRSLTLITLLPPTNHTKISEYFLKVSHDEFSSTKEDIYKHVRCTACIAMLSDGEIIVLILEIQEA